MANEYELWRCAKREYEQDVLTYNREKELIDNICNDLEGLLPVEVLQKLTTKFLVKPMRPVKPKKDPNAPKRPKTGYMLYCDDHREALQKKGLKMMEISKICCAKWHKMKENHKQKPYLDLAEKARKEYSKKMETYKMEKYIKDYVNFDYLNNCAKIVQTQFKESMSNPAYQLCKKRLRNEFGEWNLN